MASVKYFASQLLLESLGPRNSVISVREMRISFSEAIPEVWSQQPRDELEGGSRSPQQWAQLWPK